MKKRQNISTALNSIPRNLFSGLVVSLIALPLSLGLAMACDAPPISGVIASIAGGVLVSIFGGSFVTISGPGKGLVAVILIAVSTLGLNATYAAIICSGILLLTLGFLRLGKLSDYFPSSAIQGVLAAIGLIILGKQFHIMLANKIAKDNTIEYLIAIPKTVITALNYSDTGLKYAALAGVISLLIMIFYSKIRNRYLQLVPAPMWIVILSLSYSYYCEFVLGLSNPISKKYMIPEIPNIQKIITDLPVPDFSLISSSAFWISVIALTLIASIESLLSIKAVDRLDPMKRRSNVNKDIKALGLSTVFSGFLGGLNVVAVIAPSSVNISNGGSNRFSNFSHALFLTLFIVLFSTELERIPLSALMSILVYTGYKLASPEIIRRMFLIGKEQLIIFLVTLLATLKIGLISGIVAGVFTTFIIHVFISKSFQLFFKNVLKPNVLMYKENDENYFISVKHFSSFLNFRNLKNKLDVIPEKNSVVIDFSLCAFVDHTVMENISSYQALFNKKGGSIDVIGFDVFGADTLDPFPLKNLIPISGLMKNNAGKRKKDFEALASNLKMKYTPKNNTASDHLTGFNYFITKQISHTYNLLSSNKPNCCLFDISYSEGVSIAKENIRSTMMYIQTKKIIPQFTLTKEGYLERFYSLTGKKDIDVTGYENFSKRFYLNGKSPKKILELFDEKIIHFFENNEYYHVESDGSALLIFSKERVATVKEIEKLFNFGLSLTELVDKK